MHQVKTYKLREFWDMEFLAFDGCKLFHTKEKAQEFMNQYTLDNIGSRVYYKEI